VFAADKPEQRHMLAVVDTSNDGLLIVKVVLRDANDLDERNFNIYNALVQDSQW
jgi:hypothetical protein